METMTQQNVEYGRSYTRDEQITALTQIIHDKPYIPQRALARAVWNAANGRLSAAWLDLSANDAFVRNAVILVCVPLATVYNRIRRITGKIK